MMGRPNPYVGLVPFTEADAEWFFGRDQEVRLITANLRAARLTLLYGASGVGKSSVLLAGVLPRLRAIVGEHRPVAAGNGHGTLLADRPPVAVIVFREWRDPPLARLAAEMRDAVVDACDDDGIPAWDGVEPIVNWLRVLTAHARTLLVVLDQFEEYFQYHPDETGPGTFGTEFAAIVNDRDLRVHFLISLREDAWSRLDRFKGEVPELFGNYLRVDYLDRVAAHEAIVKPLDHFNATAEEPVTIEPELVDAILRDVRTGRLALAESQATGPETDAVPTGDERVETPYLQLVMDRLWAAGMAGGGHALTLATLQDLGGAASIVSSHLTDAMAALSEGDQATAADVFGFLVTPSKTKIAHRASDLAYWAQRPEADVRRVLDDLASGERRILRRVPPPADEEVERYEIFHDVLADAILEWAGENRGLRARAAAREVRRRARRRITLRILGAVAIVAAIVAAILVWNHERSHNNDVAAQDRARLLARNAEVALSTDSERALLLALAAYRTSPTTEAGHALGKAFVAARARAKYVDGPSPPCPTCRPRGDRLAALSPVAFGSAAVPYDFAFSAEAVHGGANASLSRDGGMLAIIRHGRVHLWQPATGTADAVPRVRGASDVAFVGGGRRVAVVTGDGRVLLAGPTGEPRVLGGRGSLLAVSADGRYVARASRRRIRVWPLGHPGAARSAKLTGYAARIAFSPTDSGLIAITRLYGNPALLHWRSGVRSTAPRERTPATGPGLAPQPVDVLSATCNDVGPVFSADGRLLVTPGGNGVVGRTVPSLKKRFEVPQVGACASVVRIDPRRGRVLVASGSVATVYSGRNGAVLSQLGGHTAAINDAAFSRDGRQVATASADGSARVWDTQTGGQLLDLRGTGLGRRVAPLASVAFTPDGRFLATTDEDGVARMWDISRAMRHLGAWRRNVVGAGLAKDGQLLAALDGGRIVSVEPGASGAHVVVRTPRHLVYAVFSADGTHAAALQFNGSLEWLAIHGGKPTQLTSRFIGGAISLSEDGRDVLVNGSTRLRIWHDGRPGVATPLNEPERRGFTWAELSKNGRRALIVRSGRGARIVDLDGSRSVNLSRVAASEINAADFSPSGAQVVTAGQRGAVVWDATTGHQITTLGTYGGPVTSAAFSRPDGREIATIDGNGGIRIFDASSHAETSVLPPRPGAGYWLGFNSTTKTAAVVGDNGLAALRCGACQTPKWLADHAAERLPLTRKQVDASVSDEMSHAR